MIWRWLYTMRAMDRAFLPTLLAFLIGSAAFAQSPGSGPNVAPLGQYGPPFTVQNGHFSMGQTNPPTANSACGTGATIVGTDSAFVLTSGTTSNSGCTITPLRLWNARPVCSVDAQAATQPAWSIASNGTITLSGVADSTIYNVLCIGQPGG